MRAEGLNTLVINPDSNADQDSTAAAKIVGFESKPNRAMAAADLTAAYARHARKVTRGLALLERKQVLVQDEMRADQPAEVWWFLHTPAQVKISDGGLTATLRHGSARLVARILSPANAAFTVMDAAPFPTSPHPERQNQNDQVRKLAIHFVDAKDVRVAVLLTPAREGETVETSLPSISPLADW